MAEPLIVLEDVHKRYASGLVALQNVSFTVTSGEFVSLLGPSGCGKSTALRLIAALDTPSSGRIASPAWAKAPPATAGCAGSADTAFVFQDASLMPWASVFDNVWLPLRLAGVPRQQAAPRIAEQLAAMGLVDFAQTFPAQLSGGMKMRASIARALVTRPRVLLMDEPFAALDEFTRQKLNGDLLARWLQQQWSALFVTHSVFEAVFLSQRVLVMGMRPGRVLADIAVEEPFPRGNEFRTSKRYAETCRAVTAALEDAHAPSPSA